jgi:hypothetical protein
MANFQPVVAISCGGKAELTLTRDDDLVAVQEYAPNLRTRINFGRMTVTRIEELKGYLDRLVVHAVE